MKETNSRRLFLSQLSKLLAATCIVFMSIGNVQADKPSGFALLKSGDHFAMMRHAIAPGFGDPSDFELRNCSTQRNLSQAGIEQSKRIGDRFRDNGIKEAQVYTSQWCRCIDTATLLNLGEPIELPAMNSFFETPERETDQNEQLQKWLAEQDLSEPLVLVAHQVNITALTGIFPSSGEIVIVKRLEDGTLETAGRIRTE